MKENRTLKWKPLFRWPSGREKSIFSLNIDIKQFAEKHGLPLIRHKDDLDWYYSTFFHLDDLDLVALIEYDNAPKKGVIVNVDFDIRTELAVNSIKSALGLVDKEILWTQSEID